MAQRIDEIYRTETTLIENCENLVLLFGLQQTQRDDMTAFFRCARGLAARRPAGVGVFLCVLPGTRPPEPGLRDSMTQNLKDLPGMRGLAWVLLGEGFMPAAARSILAAVTVTIRSKYPTKVFSDCATGLSWLLEHLEGADGSRFDSIALADHVSRIVRGGHAASADSISR